MTARDHHRVPDALRSPIEVMLAKSAEAIPRADALPGGTVYELKWDGVRAVIVNDDDDVSIWSRHGKQLTESFPDVAAAARAHVLPGSVLDGEIVVWNGDRLDFGEVARRIGARNAAARLARALPASYVAFDILASEGVDLRRRSWAERRIALEQAASKWAAPLSVSPSTSDPDTAFGWFSEMHVAGIEGLVAKGASQRYTPGGRGWLKVKSRTEHDVVCAGVIGPVTEPTVVVAGLPIDGELRIVGRTVPLSKTASRALGALLVESGPEHPWPEVITASAAYGFGADRSPVRLTRVQPIVVEVSADVAWSGRSYRHPLRYLRARPDALVDDVVAPD